MSARRYTIEYVVQMIDGATSVNPNGRLFVLELCDQVAGRDGRAYSVETWRPDPQQSPPIWNTAVLTDGRRWAVCDAWIWDTWQEARESHHLIARRLAAGLSVEDFA